MHILEQIVEKERTVCIIDDDKIQHFIHERCLQQHGLSRPMMSFFDGADALSFLHQHAEDLSVLPDIIFLDLNMPKLSGLQFLEQYAGLKDRLKKHIRIYILSSCINKQEMDLVTSNSEVSGFYSKPLRPHELHTILAG